jgi:hypothetical protein
MEAGFGRGGIDAGLGRGMPDGLGRPPGAAGRVPWLMPNGLLPAPRGGRAAGPGVAPGRGAKGAPGAVPPPAAGTGRGPVGRGAAVVLPRSWAARTAASCSALSAAARVSPRPPDVMRAVGATAGAGAGGLLGQSRPGAGALRGGAGFTPTSPRSRRRWGRWGGCGSGLIDARSRRATGAPIVLDADLTYSPISWSFPRTVLLSTPSCFTLVYAGLSCHCTPHPRSAGSPARPHSGHLKADHFSDFIVCSC